MSQEVPHPTDYGFDFSENEQLFYRIDHERFQVLFADAATTIHRIEVSYNNYGEFLFITASRETPHGRQPVTFYSQGYHEQRERWISQEWFWYKANAHSTSMARTVPKEEAEEILKERLSEIAPYISQAEQTRRGRLFEMLADLTDEDGAYTELEDLADLDFDELE